MYSYLLLRLMILFEDTNKLNKNVQSAIDVLLQLTCICFTFSFCFLRWTFVGSALSVFFSSLPQRPMTSDFEGFSTLHLFSYLNS